MARETTLTLVVQARNATKRALSGAERGIKGFATRARSRFRRIRQAIFSVRGALTAVAGAGALVALGKKVFDLGSAVEETASKYRTTFGPAVQEVNAFLDDFAAKAGLSNSEAQELTATTGAMLRGMGNTQEEAAALSEQVLQLAGDMTSFNNVPIEETTRAIQAAITGEREQLKRLGIVIRETDVQNRALAMSGVEAADALTQEHMAAATLALITERMGPALGDLNRTQDSAANRARRVAAEFRSLRETMATALLPVVEEVLNLLDKLDFVKFAAAVQTDIGQAFLNLGIVIGAKLGEGIFRGLEKVLRESNILARLPGPVGDFFDRINVAAAGAGELADIARDSAEDAGEAIQILAEAGGNLDALTAQLERARERLAQARGGGGGGQEAAGIQASGRLQPSTVGMAGPATGGGGGVGGMVQGRDFTFRELQDFARMASEGVDVGPVEQLLDGWRAVGFEIAKVTENQRTMDQVMADITTQTIQGFTNAFQAAAKAAVTGSKSIGEAFRGAMLGALAEVAAAMSKFYAAKAAAALGEGLLGNPAGFAAAAKFTAAAAAFGALSGLLQGVAQGGGGPAAAARAGADRQRDQTGEPRQETTIIVKGGLLNLNDPQQRRDLERALSGAGSLGNVNIVSG